MADNDSGGVGVADDISKLLGRPVKALSPVQSKPAAAAAPARNEFMVRGEAKDPGSMHEADAPKRKGPLLPLDQVLGRKVSPVPMEPIVQARFQMYAQARKNGFDPQVAAKTAMAEAAVMTPDPSNWRKFTSALRQVPTGTGKTFGDVGDQLGEVLHRSWSNPMAVSDEDWEKAQKQFGDFIDKKQKEFGPGVASEVTAGVYKGLYKFGGEQMAPAQIALLIGTFGESALIRAGLKLGIKGAPAVARTLSKLMQIQFGAQMVEGTASGIEQTVDAVKHGNWQEAGEAAVGGLISGVMAKGLATHEMATERVRGDLEKTAREMYGQPEGGPIGSNLGSRFESLNPYDQALVIDKTVKSQPEYAAFVAAAEANNEKERKKTEPRLTSYNDHAISQAWEPDSVKRIFGWIDESHRLDREHEEKSKVEATRQHYLRQIVATLRTATEENTRFAEEQRLEEEKAAEEGRTARPARKAEQRQKKSVTLTNAQQTREARVAAVDIRAKADKQRTVDEDVRKVDAHVDADGHTSYQAQYYGETNNFGVAGDENHMGVYRETPRGVEYMTPWGTFSDNASEAYIAPDEHTAETLAQISSLRHSAESLAEQEGTNSAHHEESAFLSGLERDLASGEKTADEVRKEAKLPKQIELPTEVDALYAGNLKGPLADKSEVDYLSELDQQATDAGYTPEKTDALLQGAGIALRAETENNLHHVTRSGDYIESKKGVRWTLDSRGTMHPSDGSGPVPLLKNGRYSSQMVDIARSGKVGWASETRESRRLQKAKERAVQAAFTPEISRAIDDAIVDARKQQQNEGLVTLPGEEPTQEPPDQTKARARQAVKEHYKEQREKDKQAAQNIANLIQQSLEKSGAKELVQHIADGNGFTLEQVVRAQLATNLDSLDGQIASLEPGDKITDKFRPDHPWVVERRPDGEYVLTSRGASLPLDHLNPSNRVKGLVREGGIEQTHPINEGNIERAAFKAPYIVNRDQLVDQVEAIAAGERQVPEPSTLAQAQAQAAIAERRTEAAMSNASDKQADVLDPIPGSTENDVEVALAESEKAIHTAEQAVVQEAQAQSKTVAESSFPARAPISIGRRGNAGVIKQNGLEIPVHYEMVPVDALVPSHIWRGNVLEVNPEYTKELQPRTINEKQSIRTALRGAIRQPGATYGYDFDLYADRTIGGSTGPAIVEAGGRVVGGNRRISIMRKYLQNLEEISDPDDRAVAQAMFRDQMKQLAREHGIEPPDDSRDYVVVRMMDEPIDTLRRAAELGRLFNKSVSEAMNGDAKGISYAKSLTPENIGTIGRLIEDHDGLLSAIAANPSYFARMVTDRFGVSEEEYADWFEPEEEGKPLQLNDTGKKQFSKIMLGTVFKDSTVLDAIYGEVPYRALERAMANLIRLRAIGDKNITPKIIEAVTASAQTIHTDPALSHANDKWAATYRPDQVAFLGMDAPPPPEPDRMTEVLWRALHGSKAASPRVFSERLDNLIGHDSAKNLSIFEQTKEETPAEVFNRVFSKELAEVAHSRKDGPKAFRGISQAEYDASLLNVEFSDVTREDAIRAEEGKPPKEQPKLVEERPKKNSGSLTPPPFEAPATPEGMLFDAKAEKGFVTPNELQEFLAAQEATKEHTEDIMRIAQMMAEYVFDGDPPDGVDRKDALGWVLKERVAKLEGGTGKGRGSYSDPLIEKGLGTGILKLTKAADETTFIHEFAHVIFPLLSEQDHRNINTIHHEKFPQWDITKPLRGDAYRGVTEKFAYALEKFLRDQNPRGFSAEVKILLAKVKEMVRKAYLRFIGDPLSTFQLTPEAKGIFTQMFHIEDLDISDSWHEEVKKAKAAEKSLKGPLDEPHPVAKLAQDLGAEGIRKNFGGKIVETSGDRVDPRKPTAVLYFPDIEKAATAWADVGNPKSKIQNAEMIQAEDGSYGIRFNTDKQVPNDVLYQDVQRKHPALELEELKKRLASTPTSAPLVRKLLETKVKNLENEIRARAGFEERKPIDATETAKAAVQEKKNASSGKQTVPELRRLPEGPPGDLQRRGDRQVLKPAVLGRQDDAAVRRTGGPLPGTRQLTGARPVGLQPLPDRGQPVGITHGSAFSAGAWLDGLRKAGLPDNLPPPTVSISHDTAQQLKYAGQKQIVQAALSALEQGDGFVLAAGTGTGKTFHIGGIIKEFQQANPAAKILYITKNTSLLESGEKSFKNVAKGNFGLEVNTKVRKTFDKGIHGTTYQRLLTSDVYKNTDWDLVVADESGEMRNWYQKDSQQGKAAMEVIDKAKKAVYSSATPFHSPSEYGYVKKLGLWKPNEFDQWIAENFNHEKLGDKIVAKLDPGKQAILRNQLIERGQFVSQMISYDGFTTNFGIVPVTEETRRSLNRIHEGVSRAKAQLEAKGKKALAARLSAFEATYTKAFLERTRVPEAIELAKRAREAGWHPIFFSETTSADLFRRPLLNEKGEEIEEAGTYRKLDQEMQGELSRIIPEFGNVFDDLQEAFGDQIGDYSGGGGTDAQRMLAKEDYNEGRKPFLYTTYAAGGIGVSLHDEQGTRPRLSIFLGPPYSGVLLEQAMGRTWRFGVKSDARAVFLATDSQPDIHLMATKIGPRMRALRASVQGERDALGSVMGNYSEEQKVRDQQDLLAYDQGNEVKVSANSFQQRATRKVDIDNWSQINFPKADTAHNKGMKIEMAGNGDDWATLYQDDAPRRKSSFNRPPPTLGEMAAQRKINQIAKATVEGKGLPQSEPILQVDPADKEVFVGGASAVASSESSIPVDRDNAAVARMAMERLLLNPATRNSFKWNPETLAYEYAGTPMEFADQMAQVKAQEEKQGEDHRVIYLPIFTNQEVAIRDIGWQSESIEPAKNIVRMQQSFAADKGVTSAEFASLALDGFREAGLDPRDPRIMSKVWDVARGVEASADKRINQVALSLSSLHQIVHGEAADAGVAVMTPDGREVPFKDFPSKPGWMPVFHDWKAELEDPLTGKMYTLKEVMGKTFAEKQRERILKKRLAESMSKLGYEDYVKELKQSKRLRAPVLGHMHRTREMDFPIIRKDWATLLRYYDQAAEAIASEKNFGHNLKKLNAEIGKIKSENGQKAITGMFRSLLTPEHDADSLTGKLYNNMTTFEMASKMTLSAIKVPWHVVHAPLALGVKFSPVLKAGAQWLKNPKAFMEHAAYVGTVTREANPYLLLGDAPVTGLPHAVMHYSGFDMFYRWGRALAGAASRIYLEQYALKKLIKFDRMREREPALSPGTHNFRGEDLVRRVVKDNLLIGDHAIDQAIQRGSWAKEDLDKAEVAFANMVMFSEHNSLQMPTLARLNTEHSWLNNTARMTYALQTFAVKETSFLRQHLFDEVVIHRNFKPLIWAVVAEPILGQALMAMNAAAKGGIQRGIEDVSDKKHKKDAWDKYLDLIKDDFSQGVLGTLRFVVDGAAASLALDRMKRYGDATLDAMMGEKQQARASVSYWVTDEAESAIGPDWSTLVWTPLKEMSEEFNTEIGHKDPARDQKWHDTQANFWKWMIDEFPILREEPHITEWASKARQSSSSGVSPRTVKRF